MTYVLTYVVSKVDTSDGIAISQVKTNTDAVNLS